MSEDNKGANFLQKWIYGNTNRLGESGKIETSLVDKGLQMVGLLPDDETMRRMDLNDTWKSDQAIRDHYGTKENFYQAIGKKGSDALDTVSSQLNNPKSLYWQARNAKGLDVSGVDLTNTQEIAGLTRQIKEANKQEGRDDIRSEETLRQELRRNSPETKLKIQQLTNQNKKMISDSNLQLATLEANLKDKQADRDYLTARDERDYQWKVKQANMAKMDDIFKIVMGGLNNIRF